MPLKSLFDLENELSYEVLYITLNPTPKTVIFMTIRNPPKAPDKL